DRQFVEPLEVLAVEVECAIGEGAHAPRIPVEVGDRRRDVNRGGIGGRHRPEYAAYTGGRMTSERRAFLRVEADLPVLVARLDAAGDREPPTTGRSVDISAGGLRLAAGHGCRPGDRLWLEVQFRQPHFLVFADAEVVRIDDDGSAGVRFDELETYTQQRVIRWVYAQDRRLFDRRAQTRFPLRIRALVQRIAPDGQAVEAFAAPTLDISIDGIRIASERMLEV